jgi:electron transfer flavoprotein alpha subunit
MTQAIVFVEHAEGTPRRASLECVGAAVAAGAQVTAVLTGTGAEAAASKVVGATDAVVLTADGYSSDAFAVACADLVKTRGAKAFFAAATYRGKDLAPRVAALLDVNPFADCTGLSTEGGAFQVRRPWLAGKCIATLGSSGAVMVATTRLNVFKPATSGAPASASLVAVTATPKASVTGIQAKSGTRLDVKEAPVVISGGRGLQDAEKFKILEDLAAAFGNAAVGASRAIVDAGWRPHNEQVGQTGKTVSPQLYIAVGISGAIQHLAGMRTSGTIVAINKDKDAPIFKVADYGIVGDAFEIVPALTAAVKAIKSQA